MTDPELDRVFHALSDSTRRAILVRLAEYLKAVQDKGAQDDRD